MGSGIGLDKVRFMFYPGDLFSIFAGLFKIPVYEGVNAFLQDYYTFVDFFRVFVKALERAL